MRFLLRRREIRRRDALRTMYLFLRYRLGALDIEAAASSTSNWIRGRSEQAVVQRAVEEVDRALLTRAFLVEDDDPVVARGDAERDHRLRLERVGHGEVDPARDGRAAARAGALDLADAVVSEGDVVLTLDDVHALDRTTLEIVLDMTRRVGHRFSIVAAMRPEGTTATLLGARPDVRLIRVPGLDAASARRIVSRSMPAELAAKRAKLIDWALEALKEELVKAYHRFGDRLARAVDEPKDGVTILIHVKAPAMMDALFNPGPLAAMNLAKDAILGQAVELSVDVRAGNVR